MGLVAGGVGLVVFGIIVLITGFFINSYTQDNVSQCGQWYGQLGQMLDPETSQSCQNVSMMQAASQAGIIVGIILAVIGIICLGIGLSRAKSKQSPSQKLGEKQ
jgi:ABC-type antimicrobial peptide transport system permease subunit